MSNLAEVYRRSVLLIEDDDLVRDEISDLLREEGFEVVSVANGFEALSRLQQGAQADVIVMDLRMPVMSGWEFRVEQRHDPKLAAIPVIAISADASPQARAVHADYFIQKPFTGKALINAVNQVLEEKERVRESVEQAHEERVSSIGLLASGVAHEINNPLTYLFTSLEFASEEVRAMEEGSVGESLRSVVLDLAEARHGAERIKRIVEDLQRLGRRQEGVAEEIDLRHVLSRCIGLTREQLRRNARVREILHEVPHVKADEVELSHVFINLLLSAAQAFDEAGPERNLVEIITRTDPYGWAVIQIRDTGRGISEADLPRIFDPFFNARAPGRAAGLGLAIAHGIVRSLGGRIEVESKPGKGTVFRVLLPPASSDRIEGDAAARDAAESAQRILVIDDEESARAATKRVLSADYDVDVVGSAAAALSRILSGQRYAAILCDVTLHGTSGTELLDRVRDVAPDQADRVVFVADERASEEAREEIEEHAVPLVEKPVRLTEVRALIQARKAPRASQLAEGACEENEPKETP